MEWDGVVSGMALWETEEEEEEEVWEDAEVRHVERAKWNAGWNEEREDTRSVPCSWDRAGAEVAEMERLG